MYYRFQHGQKSCQTFFHEDKNVCSAHFSAILTVNACNFQLKHLTLIKCSKKWANVIHFVSNSIRFFISTKYVLNVELYFKLPVLFLKLCKLKKNLRAICNPWSWSRREECGGGLVLHTVLELTMNMNNVHMNDDSTMHKNSWTHSVSA